MYTNNILTEERVIFKFTNIDNILSILNTLMLCMKQPVHTLLICTSRIFGRIMKVVITSEGIGIGTVDTRK